VIRPKFAKDSVDFGFSETFGGWKGSNDLGKEKAATAFARRPPNNPALSPERSELSHFLRGCMLMHDGHDLILGRKDCQLPRVH
jgi:hypothetical protein